MGFPAQRQLQQVRFDPLLDRCLELALDLKEPVRRAQSADPLVGPAVVVVFDPEPQALLGRLERIELRPHQELLPQAGPEPLDFAERHRVLRARDDLRDPVFAQLRRKPALAPPAGVLPAPVGEHLLGRGVFADRDPVGLNHRLGRGAPKQSKPHDVPGVVVHEGDDVGVLPAQPEREDVALPHLVGRGPLEETRAGEIAPRLRPLLHQTRCVQGLADGLRAGFQKEPSLHASGELKAVQ